MDCNGSRSKHLHLCTIDEQYYLFDHFMWGHLTTQSARVVNEALAFISSAGS